MNESLGQSSNYSTEDATQSLRYPVAIGLDPSIRAAATNKNHVAPYRVSPRLLSERSPSIPSPQSIIVCRGSIRTVLVINERSWQVNPTARHSPTQLLLQPVSLHIIRIY